MKNKILYIAIGFILGILIYYLFFNKIINKNPDRIQKITIRDTVIKITNPEPIIITKTLAKIIEKRDTIIQTKPFRAQLDTIIKMDTISLSYDFPENELSMVIRSQPDTLMLREIIKETPPEETSFWSDLLKIAGGAFLGIVIGLAAN